jgi:hypothetical protein
MQESDIADTISKWLQTQLDETAKGLRTEPRKTKVTVEGRDRRFLVRQSKTATRIQREVSGTFDMLHGTELIGAIEGFFHTQHRYSQSREPEVSGRAGLLIGMSDLRDDTAARFAAGKFRRTFRSLRPLLEDERIQKPLQQEQGKEEERTFAETPRLVLSKQQLDERGRLFAAMLIEEWVANPSNIRLVRIALDSQTRNFLIGY